jgi:transglutaminase-like putative cysteine protease
VVSLPNSAGVKDVIAWVTAQSLSSGNQYKVRALIADPNVEDLRAAGTQYPRWVSEKYLEVPNEINPQLKELALQITQPYETVYDKTQAITSYLRNEITYTSKIADTLPRDKDPVLWVLFDYKKGFCMYYASAEVLMLRSIGIPARMAVGFAEGTFSEINWRYTVVYKDSHAWPEVYFPGIGWVEFEPTSNQPPVNRPEKKDTPDATPTVDPNAGNLAANSSTPVPARGRNEPPEPEIASRTFLTKSYLNALILMLVACMAGVGIYLTRRYSIDERLPVYLIGQYEKRGNTPPSWLHRWARWANLLPIERTFQTINLCLSWLGHPQPRHVTSQGRAEVLIGLLPSAKDQILLLLQEYQTAIYTPRREDVPAARKAALTILKKTLQLRYKEALKFVNTRYN